MAASGAGDVAKTAIGVAGRLRRQWLRWLTEHGEAYEYDATVGPTVGHVLHFQTHGFKTRQNYSSLQLDGLGDSWGELAVPYLLAKFVFTELKYPRMGWVEGGRVGRQVQAVRTGGARALEAAEGVARLWGGVVRFL